MSQYGKPEYWEERYTRDPEPFDWYQRFNGLKDVLTPHITPESKILNVGSGNSRLSEEMFDEGYQNITNIDISHIVTKAMNDKYKEKGPNFRYLHMDARAMEFEDGSFDVVLDKGTVDAVLCGESSATNCQKMISEVHRVLGPKGTYIVISYGLPEHRLVYLEKPEYDWGVIVQQVHKPTISTSIAITNEDKDSPNVHYIYICKKVVINIYILLITSYKLGKCKITSIIAITLMKIYIIIYQHSNYYELKLFNYIISDSLGKMYSFGQIHNTTTRQNFHHCF